MKIVAEFKGTMDKDVLISNYEAQSIISQLLDNCYIQEKKEYEEECDKSVRNDY